MQPGDVDTMRILLVTAKPLEARQHASTDTGQESLQIAHVGHAVAASLEEALLAYQPTVIHFIGHGAEDEHIAEDLEGSKRGGSEALMRLLGTSKGEVRLMVLRADAAEDLTGDVKRHVDCVIALNLQQDHEASIAFATAFYEALGAGVSIRAAFEEGQAEAELAAGGKPLQDPPRLVLREGDDADGQVPTKSRVETGQEGDREVVFTTSLEASEFEQTAFVKELAVSIGIPASKIRVKGVREGSLVVTLEFTDEEALAEFLNKHHRRDARLQAFYEEWSVAEVTVVSDKTNTALTAPTNGTSPNVGLMRATAEGLSVTVPDSENTDLHQEGIVAQLLGETFSASELYTFLRHQGAVALVRDLPSPEVCPRATYAARVAEKLVERRLLTPAFVNAWAARFPSRADEIRAVWSR